MMGRQNSDQASLFYEFRLDERIPKNHLLQRINVFVTAALADVHEQLDPYYSEIGRPSVDPELMIRMLIALRSSASHQPLIPCDRALEVVVFLATDEAEVFQMREVLLGGGSVAEHQCGFAEMLVGTAMARIERQRLLVMSDRRPHLAQPPIGIANVVLAVPVTRSA